jgi:hypothetical protein
MLDVSTVLDLHGQGLSQRAIARHLTIARGTVLAIIHKRHPANRPTRTACTPDSSYSPAPGQAPTRCKSCGARIYPPCLACHVRKTG